MLPLIVIEPRELIYRSFFGRRAGPAIKSDIPLLPNEIEMFRKYPDYFITTMGAGPFPDDPKSA